MRELFTQATYLAASVFFILGLRSLSNPERARAGMNQAAIGMLLAVLGTLVVRRSSPTSGSSAGSSSWPSPS